MFNFLGSLASLIGLVFSLLAFIFAKRASTAAREARDAAMRQSLGEDINSAGRIANEIASCLYMDRSDMALQRIGELMDETSYLISRWEARMPKKSKDNLSLAREELRLIHSVLITGGVLAPQERARLAQAGRRISGIFSEEHGVAVSAAEAREK